LFFFGQDCTTLVVKGIQLITLYYTDPEGKSVPINYRVYNKQEGKTKNEYLREMINEVLLWGVSPKIVTTDIALLAKKI
jgi:C4-type Zn-finger protein